MYVPEPDEVERSVLGMLLDRYPALVAIEDELIRDLNHPSRQDRVPARLVRDAVESLAKDGLAYVLDEKFVIASWNAVRSNELRGAEH